MDPCVKDKILNVEPSNWGHQCDRQMMRLVMEENDRDRAAPKHIYKQNLASDLVELSLNQGQGLVQLQESTRTTSSEGNGRTWDLLYYSHDFRY